MPRTIHEAEYMYRYAYLYRIFDLSFCGVPITENLLKETAARSPVKLLFCWADQPNKKYILTGACALGEWRLGAFPFQELVVIEMSMFVHEFKRLLEHAWNHNGGRNGSEKNVVLRSLAVAASFSPV